VKAFANARIGRMGMRITRGQVERGEDGVSDSAWTRS